jgi:threonine/homoserine efflux transporter RhtA
MTKFKATKAWVAAAIAGLSFAVPVVDDGLSLSEALGCLLAALAGFQAVYWTTNKEKA